MTEVGVDSSSSVGVDSSSSSTLSSLEFLLLAR